MDTIFSTTTIFMEPNLSQIAKIVKASIESAIASANKECRLHQGGAYKPILSAAIDRDLKLLCSKLPLLLYQSGIIKTVSANAKYNIKVDIKESSLLDNQLNGSSGNKAGYKVSFSISAFLENKLQDIQQGIKNTVASLDSLDWQKNSQIARKISSGLLTTSLTLQKTFERASLYSPPQPGSRALVIFEKKIFNQRIIHRALFEMNAVQAGKLATGFKIAGKSIGILGGGMAVYDISKNGFTTSNTLDLTMSALAVSGVGTSIAGTYFLINGACLIFTDKDLGQHIDGFIKKF